MTMKQKRLCQLFGAACLVVVATGCADKPSESTNPNATPPPPPANIDPASGRPRAGANPGAPPPADGGNPR